MLSYTSNEMLMREMSSLRGNYLGISTMIILVLCLLSASFEIGDEGNRTLTWNRKNNDDANDALIFTFELRPASPSVMMSHWDDSLDVSATMMKHQLNLGETKDFLEKNRCEILLPTVNFSPFYIFGNDLAPKTGYEINYSQMTCNKCSPM